METHTREKYFQCGYCDKEYKRSCSLKKHVRIHMNEIPYQCSHCDKIFINNGDLESHVRNHSGKKTYKCSHCDLAFSKNKQLHVHILMTHIGEKPYQCGDCDEAFLNNDEFKRHVTIHLGGKPYRCSECGKSFSFNSSLIRHVRIHTGNIPRNKLKIHPGNIPQNQLKIHTWNIPRNKLTKCCSCSMGFSQNYQLEDHMIKAHSELVSKEKEKIHDKNKFYRCNLCYRGFIQELDLIRHWKLAMNGEPITLEERSLSKTKSNTRIKDTGNIPQNKLTKCCICYMAFSQNYQLEDHMIKAHSELLSKEKEKIHDKNKFYRCNLCYKGFTKKIYLIRHRKLAIKREPIPLEERLLSKTKSNNIIRDVNTDILVVPLNIKHEMSIIFIS